MSKTVERLRTPLFRELMSRLFISHSSKNNAEALALQAWLARHGWARDDVFLDIDPHRGIVAGQRWAAALTQAASRCEAVLCVITRDWLESSYCRVELNLAKTLGKQIFGVIARPTPFEEIARKLPELTSEYQIVDLSTEGDKEEIAVVLADAGRAVVSFRKEGLVRLRAGLEKAGLDARWFAFDPARAIFPGLKALEEQDAAIFFGRDGRIVEGLDELRKAVTQLRAHVFAVVGASGAGKSSFLRAGLFPRLERDDRHWLPLPVVRPFNAVLSNQEGGLVRSLERAYESLSQRRAQGDLRLRLGEPRGFVKILDELRSLAHALLLDQHAPLPTIVLPIDQGEELFDAPQREAAPLTDLIATARAADEEDWRKTTEAKDASTEADALRLQSPRLVILITIRSDSFEKLQSNAILSPQRGAVFSLPPLPKGAFKDVIEGPVRRLKEASGDGVLRLDDRLVEQLLEDVGGESADALPLLAFVLERLFTDFGKSGELTLDHYNRTGRLQGAIVAAVKKAFDDDADPAIPTDPKIRETLLRRAFIPWLARIDEASGEVKRSIAHWEDIPAESRPLIERLVNVRLLRMHQPVDEKGTRSTPASRTVEPAHEALLRQWPDLVSWIKEERSNLLALDALLRAANDWHSNGGSTDWIVHKAGRLVDAEALDRRDDYARKVAGIPRKYLLTARGLETAQRTAEREQVEREKKQLEEISKAERLVARRTRVGLIATGALLLVAIALAGYSLVQRDAAVEQTIEAERRSGLLSARAARSLTAEGSVDAALLLLLKAAEAFDDKTAPDELLVALSDTLDQAAQSQRIRFAKGFDAFHSKTSMLIADRQTNDVFQFEVGVLKRLLPGRPADKAILHLGRTEHAAELAIVRDDLEIELVDTTSGHRRFLGKFPKLTESAGQIFEETTIKSTGDGLIIRQTQYSDDDRPRDPTGTFLQMFDLKTGNVFQRDLKDAEFLEYVNLPSVGRLLFDGNGVSEDDSLREVRVDSKGIELAIRDQLSGEKHWEMINRLCLARDQSVAVYHLRRACLETKGGEIQTWSTSTSAGLERIDRFVRDSTRAPVIVTSSDESVDGDDDREVDIRKALALHVPAISDLNFSWIEAAPASTLIAVVSNRDVYVFDQKLLGEEAAADPDHYRTELLSLPHASAPSMAKFVGGNKLATLEPRTGVITIRDINIGDQETTGGLRSTLSAPGEKQTVGDSNPPESYHKGTCVGYAATVSKDAAFSDGRKLRFDARTMTQDADTSVLRVTADGASVAFVLPSDTGCVQASRDGKHVLVVTAASVKIYSIDKAMAERDLNRAQVGQIQASANSAFFDGSSLDVVTSDLTETVTFWRYDSATKGWSAHELYRGDNPIRYAEPDPTGDRLLIIEDLGHGEVHGFLYSLKAQEKWLDFGTEYKFLGLAYLGQRDIGVWRSTSLRTVVRLPRLSDLIDQAKNALPQSCTLSNMQDYRDSPCWPASPTFRIQTPP